MKHLELKTQHGSQIHIPETNVVMWKITDQAFIIETTEEQFNLDEYRLKDTIYVLPLFKTKFQWR